MRQAIGPLLFVLLSTGCTSLPYLVEGFAEGYAATAGSGGVPVGSGELLIFGGPGHDTFLGCLTCSEYSSDSVHNEYGFGNPYGQTIFNGYSQFGSPYSTYSACNPYASDPPVVVDEDGEFYGRLTLNRYHRQAITDDRVMSWLRGVCAS
jgi:hypothetical protein